jgi:creatinine amidohydrolase
MPHSPNMLELAKMTWPEAAAVLRAGAVVIVPVGCTEPHGPHLPLDTDVTIALAQSRRAAELLAEEGVAAVLTPPVNYGVTNFADGFAGRLSVQPATLWSILEDLVESLQQQGVRRVVLSNGHLEPEHVAVLRGVCLDHAALGAEKAQVVFADNTRRKWAAQLGADFLRGDHAGCYETSIALAADRDAVRDEVRANLPAVDIDLVGAIQAGGKGFKQIGAAQAYCGDPARATAEQGRELVETLARMVCGCVRETWPELFAAREL